MRRPPDGTFRSGRRGDVDLRSSSAEAARGALRVQTGPGLVRPPSPVLREHGGQRLLRFGGRAHPHQPPRDPRLCAAPLQRRAQLRARRFLRQDPGGRTPHSWRLRFGHHVHRGRDGQGERRRQAGRHRRPGPGAAGQDRGRPGGGVPQVHRIARRCREPFRGIQAGPLSPQGVHGCPPRVHPGAGRGLLRRGRRQLLLPALRPGHVLRTSLRERQARQGGALPHHQPQGRFRRRS